MPYFDPSYSPESPTGAAEIDLRLTSQSEYTAEAAEDVIYTWSLEPAAAGTITGEGSQALVEWDSDYRGEAKITYTYENACGATAVSEALSVKVINSTSVEEQQSTAVEVYPNPAKGFINVKTNLEGEVTIRVIDMIGRMVYESRLTKSEHKIPTSKLGGSGIYTIQIIQNESFTNNKLIVVQ